MILSNGKVITVDDQFAIAQAVGTNQNVTRLAGPSTRRIDCATGR